MSNIPFYSSKEDLEKTLLLSGIISNADINECHLFMGLNGYTIRKKRKVENLNRLVLNDNVLKKIEGFNGIEVSIGKDEKTYSAIMETERDALLLCILNVIKDRNKRII